VQILLDVTKASNDSKQDVVTDQWTIDILNTLAKIEWVKSEQKIIVMNLLKEAKVKNEAEQKADKIREKLFLYATEGYKTLYTEYEDTKNYKKLNQLQDIIFQQDKNTWLIECYFKYANMYISEEVLGWKWIKESREEMNSFINRNPEYDYPTGNEVKTVVWYCPWETYEEDHEIFKKIFNNCRFIYIKESFDILNPCEYHFIEDWKSWQVKTPVANLKAWTLWFRKWN